MNLVSAALDGNILGLPSIDTANFMGERGQSSVDDILEKANGLGLNLEAEGEKIVMPTDKKDIKKLLRFLDDGIYEAPLSTKKYMTNSKRPLQ
jgi:hypothetical protein